MKKYFLLLLVSTSICRTNGASAMEKDITEEVRKNASPKVVLVLPPEHMETINKMNLLAVVCPQIAQSIPTITSAEEFKVAKEYLECTKQYNKYLLAGAMYGPRVNGTKGVLIEDSQRVLKGLLTYIVTLQGPSCSPFRSSEDEKAFEVNAYEAQYNLAQNHLMLLIATILTPNLKNDSLTINGHVQEVKKIKENLSGSSQYRKQLQQAIKKLSRKRTGITSPL